MSGETNPTSSCDVEVQNRTLSELRSGSSQMDLPGRATNRADLEKPDVKALLSRDRRSGGPGQ
jgi:hypothetical protein